MPRTAHVAAHLADGQVLITGGSTREGEVVASAEVYNPRTSKFSRTGEMKVVRHKHGAAPLPDGRVLNVGGSDASESEGRYASAEVYDNDRGVFSATAPMAAERFKLPDALVTLRNGSVIVAGGDERVEVYEPRSKAFRTVEGELGAAWAFSTATLLLDGRVLIAGGYDPDIRLTASAWVYRP